MSDSFDDYEEKRQKIIGLGHRSIRKTYYGELRQSLVELRALNKNLEQLVDERTRHLVEIQKKLVESEKLAMIGSLVAGVAHEINTPVGNAITALSFLTEQSRSVQDHLKMGVLGKQELLSFLDTVVDAATISLSNLEKAAVLVQRFKQVSVDQATNENRKINLHDYLQDIILTLKPKLIGRIVLLKVDADLVIYTNPGALYQIITNLAVNTLMHGFTDQTGGTIQIEVFQSGKELCLIYQDDGIGIAPEHVELIFQPFFTTKRGQGGSGLGLSIVNNLIVQKLHGSIKYKAPADHGVIFEIRWTADPFPTSEKPEAIL